MTPPLIPPNISPKLTDFPTKMNVLFSSRDELFGKIDVMGRDAFVAEIVGNPDKYRSDTSRKSKKDKDKDGIIYLLTNLANKKLYVGQTNDFDERMRGHLSGHGGAIYLTNAIKAHGRENFVSVILLAGIEEQKELDLTEIAVIKHLESLGPGGYNLHIGGKGGPHTAATRKKIGDGNRGKRKGRTHTDEARAKISATRMGKKRPDVSAALKGKKRPDVNAARKKPVVITIETGTIIIFESAGAAAKEMGLATNTICSLANNKIKKCRCKAGAHANAHFTARLLV
jgi:group I intron endonuclease